MSDLSTLQRAVISGDAAGARDLTQALVDGGAPAQAILDGGLIAAMGEVGERFSKGKLFVPHMLRSARTMQECLDLLKPAFAAGEVTSKGTVVIGTVKGDRHDIGKNLVAMMMEGAGFAVCDLGVDVPAETFAAKATEEKADLLAMSALLSTTMPAMEATIDALQQAGVRSGIKVMIGGAPVSADHARKIGADGFAPDAGSAVAEAKRLLGG